jgi:hypothetical protein
MSAPTSASSAADPSQVSRARVSQVSLAIIVAVFGYLLIYHLHHERQGVGHYGDFPTFYEAAQFAREHRDIYKAGNAATDQTYVYPPLIAFAYGPLTRLSLPNAAAVMLFVTAAELLGALFLAGAAILDRLDAPRWPTLWAVVALACLLGENEMRGVMTMIETDSLMLLMFALGFWWLDRRPILAGLALGLAFNIKYLSIVILPYLILRRRWRAAAGMLVGCVGFALLPALQLGWREDLRCLRVSMGGLLRWVGVAPEASGSIKVHDIADGLSVSITSGLARVLHPHGMTNAQVMIVAAGVGVLSLLIVALLYRMNRLPVWVWPAREGQARHPFRILIALEWVGLVTVAIAFSPDTNARHLVLAAFVNLLGAALLLVPRVGVSRVPAGIGLALILLGFIGPFAKQLRHIGFNHYVWAVPCWCLLIGYLLVLWTGLRFTMQTCATQESAL